MKPLVMRDQARGQRTEHTQFTVYSQSRAMAFAIVRHLKVHGKNTKPLALTLTISSSCKHMQVCMGRGVLSEDLIKVDSAVNTYSKNSNS